VAFTGEGAPYIASKVLALYARPFGIGVSLLCPGGVNTNLAETGRSIGMTPERERAETAMAQSIQGGIELQPDEIATLVVEAIRSQRYLILSDPAVHTELLERRAHDLDGFLNARFDALQL
jgi:NAD(P)-dependent dehydrogenase (short-subunit alcohol dehydrogenase family)